MIGRLARLAALVPLMAGCATMSVSDSPRKNALPASPSSPERNESIARFEQNRDHVEYEAALARWNEGDAAGCREVLDQILHRTPDNRDARLLLAEVDLLEENPGQALKDLEASAKKHPDDARIQHALGLALDASNQPEGAAAHFRRAAELEPENAVYRLSYRRAAANAKDSAGGGATAIAAEMDAPPKSTREDAGVATCTDYKSSAESAEGDRLIRQGETALAQGKAQQAMNLFRQGLSQGGTAEKAVSVAVTALRGEQPGVATAVLQDATGRWPRSVAVWRALGTAEYRQGDFRSAEVALRHALSLDKRDPLTYFLLGSTQRKLGQDGPADESLRQAAQIDPRYAAWR